ncbi:MAG: LytTR family DNA-binding domain-containing protein [Bacteroidetes bacterium]|nr:LytTR family DNA-binding domain-containing protein [Bacteroidota bacterium]MBU1115733.1 LytTR family DNA-binding domain-containing protein [Bacteroidota bacterium]MBU1799898.1 LytTR family DNA-binding domain-containing protein [Bacteroidota bacterium]
MNRIFQTLVVDDEKYARSDLIDILSVYPNIKVVGEAKNIKSAIEAIEKYNPDLIFLDIQFPGETGFDLFDKINIKAKVIFVTAFDEYALRAFDVNACDYFLKPVNPERLKVAVNRLEENAEPTIKKEYLLTNQDSIYLQINYRYYFVKVDSIIKITASGHYTEIITNKGLRGLTNKHLWEWEKCLPNDFFIQVSRSIIVNTNFIEHVEKGPNYSSKIIMKNIDEKIQISRRFASHLKKNNDLFG